MLPDVGGRPLRLGPAAHCGAADCNSLPLEAVKHARLVLVDGVEVARLGYTESHGYNAVADLIVHLLSGHSELMLAWPTGIASTRPQKEVRKSSTIVTRQRVYTSDEMFSSDRCSRSA